VEWSPELARLYGKDRRPSSEIRPIEPLHPHNRLQVEAEDLLPAPLCRSQSPRRGRMSKTLTIIALLAVLPAATAIADDDCFVPMADWQPRDAVARMAEENGWTVRRIKIDDGCYEIGGRDAEGRRIEVTVHPATLQVIEIEYEDDEGRRHRERGWDEDD
jgi:hypothetical protein